MIMLSLDAVIMMAHNWRCALVASQHPPRPFCLPVDVFVDFVYVALLQFFLVFWVNQTQFCILLTRSVDSNLHQTGFSLYI